MTLNANHNAKNRQEFVIGRAMTRRWPAVVLALVILAWPRMAPSQPSDPTGSRRADTTRIEPAVHRAVPEAWTGPDKVKHFFISAFLESVAFSALEAAGADRGAARAGGIATAAAAATGREIYDRRTKGVFSIPDLLWDAAGAAAALLVLNRTQR